MIIEYPSKETPYWWVDCLKLDCKDYLEGIIDKKTFLHNLKIHKDDIENEIKRLEERKCEVQRLKWD